jgi:hypothetical protein
MREKVRNDLGEFERIFRRFQIQSECQETIPEEEANGNEN